MAITLDGTNGINSSGVIVAPDGSASAPSITNDGDTNTGIFFPAADNIGFATGGTIRGRWTTDGLCFGSDTAAANALDDYEVGTWTPNASSGSGTITTYTSSGRYVKTGDQVLLYGIINISNVGTAGGTFFWGDSPFTSATNSANSGTFLARENALVGTAYQGTVTSNGTGGVILTLTNTPITYTSGMVLAFTVIYQTA